MERITIETLLDKYLTATLSEEEQQLFARLLENEEERRKVELIIDKELRERAYEGVADQNIGSLIQENVLQKIGAQRKANVLPLYLRKLAVAAVILLVVGSGFYWWASRKGDASGNLAGRQSRHQNLPAVAAGSQPVLRLADGSEIILDSTARDTIARQGNVSIIRLQGGELAYRSGNAAGTRNLLNTITTPRGGKYELELADGTRVWLNAASSLRFPAAFTGRERRVELTGEGYFEVAKNAAMPFHVTTAGVDVEVLGTHFDVNGYANEPVVRTTLLEGRVKVSRGSRSGLLQPGQQAVAGQNGPITVDREVDVENVMAWKNGYFQFDAADVETVLRQAERWYDVRFEVSEPVTEKLSGQIPQTATIDQFLQILELTGKVHFEKKGKLIVVKH